MRPDENMFFLIIIVIFFFKFCLEILSHKKTVELQWLEHIWNHENMFETGVVQANECYHSARSGDIIGIFSRFSLI